MALLLRHLQQVSSRDRRVAMELVVDTAVWAAANLVANTVARAEEKALVTAEVRVRAATGPRAPAVRKDKAKATAQAPAVNPPVVWEAMVRKVPAAPAVAPARQEVPAAAVVRTTEVAPAVMGAAIALQVSPA